MSEPTATEQPPVIRNSDMLALKRYITSRDHNPRHGLGDTTLLIDLTHSNLVQKHIEIRFDKHDRLSDVRNKIHQKTGTAPHFQALVLKCSGQVLLELPADDESYDHHKLGYFFGDDLCLGLEVHCIDTNPLSGSSNGQYEDTSLVEKYRMTEEDYNQRKGTLRDWSRVQLEKDKNFTLARHAREHRERSEAIRQFKLGIFPLPYGYVVDSTGMDIVRGDEPDYDDLVARKQQQQQQQKTATTTKFTTLADVITEVLRVILYIVALKNSLLGGPKHGNHNHYHHHYSNSHRYEAKLVSK
mmetsp:Transcript_19112/g.40047  ORF Transcript_19112/g.40047 Transcript_19112/m.40047 type:complete len:299 (+) Transcript_19112:1352-2248(+)